MEKSFSIFENRRKVIEEKLELLLELDRILFDPDGAPHVLERHEQMMQRIAAAQEKIEFLAEQQKRAEAERRQVFGRSGESSRRTRCRKEGR